MSHEPYSDYLTCMSWVVQGKVWVMREFWPVLEFEKRIKALFASTQSNGLDSSSMDCQFFLGFYCLYLVNLLI